MGAVAIRVFWGAGCRDNPVAQTRCPARSNWVGDAAHAGSRRDQDVPVHQHLIALGFLDLIERAKDGPLFCEIGKDGTTTGPAEGVYKRILEVVRSVVHDPKVQPNHAWRYTFKTYGYEAGLDHLTLDAICGHSAKSKGDDYTRVTLKKRFEAMTAFPRYLNM
jgi:integrase